MAAIICFAVLLALILPLRFCHRAVGAFEGATKTADKGLDLADKALDKAETILAKFHAGQITHTFRESYPRIGGNNGDVLEVATNRLTELFTKSDERRAIWDRLPLGTTTAEIRLEAVFRYYVLLSDEWRLETRGNVCVVLAPGLRASLPTAIDTQTMQKSAENGWARFDKSEQLDALERGISPSLDARAMDRAHIDMIRDAARRSISEFVRVWLLKEDHWREDRFTAITVQFADEVPSLSDNSASNQ